MPSAHKAKRKGAAGRPKTPAAPEVAPVEDAKPQVDEAQPWGEGASLPAGDDRAAPHYNPRIPGAPHIKGIITVEDFIAKARRPCAPQTARRQMRRGGAAASSQAPPPRGPPIAADGSSA